MLNNALYIVIGILVNIITAANNQPTCLFVANQTTFNKCIFLVLGGAQDQVTSCSLFQGSATYGTCLCTKSKAIYGCYEQYCPTDFSFPIFQRYFWSYCQAHASGRLNNTVAPITGIPMVATYSITSTSPTSIPTFKPHSYFPNDAEPFLGTGSIILTLTLCIMLLGQVFY